MGKDLKFPQTYQKAWQTELGKTIPKSSWDTLWNTSLHTSRNINISMLSYKILYRWHLTPLKLHKINSSTSDKCWKGCGLPGSCVHCFWACPRLRPFWSRVISQIHKTVDIRLPDDPAVLILNVLTDPKMDRMQRELVELLLCAARSLIAQSWKSTKIPTVSDWFLKVWDFFLQDKVSTSLLCADNYPAPTNWQDKWLPLMSAVSNQIVDTSLFLHHIHYDLLSYF